MSKTFSHHLPGPDAMFRMAELRLKFAEVESVLSSLPNSREKSLAMTKLEETAMWANKAAVLSDPQSHPET